MTKRTAHNSHAGVATKTLVLVGLLNLLPWMIVGVLAWQQGWLAPSLSQVGVGFDGGGEAQAASPIDGKVTESSDTAPPPGWHRRTGPWGQLEYRWVQLKTPSEYVSLHEWQPNPTQWFFDRPALIEARRQLVNWGLPDELVELLDNTPDVWRDSEGGGYLTPPDELVERLPPDVRRVIYHGLGQLPNNPRYADPAYFVGAGVPEWFREASIPEEIVELVERLSFEVSGVHFFCDVDLVLRRCPDESVRRRFVECLQRRSTLIARLRVGPGDDVKALVDYWFPFRLPQSAEPLLRQMASSNLESTVDLVHLLSPLARQRLYTFPVVDDPLVGRRNCTWTAMNYFSTEPDDRFMEMPRTMEVLESEYYAVNSAPKYGDLIAWISPRSRMRLPHIAVYLGGGIVFTKNGQSARSPWILMPQEQVEAVYRQMTAPGLETVIFRRKPFPQTSAATPAEES